MSDEPPIDLETHGPWAPIVGGSDGIRTAAAPWREDIKHVR
jgi:hypothetical protein